MGHTNNSVQRSAIAKYFNQKKFQLTQIENKEHSKFN